MNIKELSDYNIVEEIDSLERLLFCIPSHLNVLFESYQNKLNLLNSELSKRKTYTGGDKKNMIIYILRGIPGSGKTTWAKSQKGVKRVNKDDLRRMLDCGMYSKENEAFVKKIRNIIINESIKANHDLIIDDTNYKKSDIDEIRKSIGASCLLGPYKAPEIQIKEFRTKIDLCIERDSLREFSVGEDVIRSLEEKFEYGYEV